MTNFSPILFWPVFWVCAVPNHASRRLRQPNPPLLALQWSPRPGLCLCGWGKNCLGAVFVCPSRGGCGLHLAAHVQGLCPPFSLGLCLFSQLAPSWLTRPHPRSTCPNHPLPHLNLEGRAQGPTFSETFLVSPVQGHPLWLTTACHPCLLCSWRKGFILYLPEWWFI